MADRFGKLIRAFTTYIIEARWVHILIPLVVLVLYFVCFSSLVTLLAPQYVPNVNLTFARKAWKLLVILGAAIYLFFASLYFRLRGTGQITFRNDIQPFYPSDLVLILLPVAPVVQYVLANRDILSLWDAFCAVAIVAAVSLVFVAGLPWVLRAVTSLRVVMMAGLSFTFTITNMASLSAQFHWFAQGVLAVQLALFAAVFLLAWALHAIAGRRFLQITVVVYLIVTSVFQGVTASSPDIMRSSTDTVDGNVRLFDLVRWRTPERTPNIYLLVYDAYVPNETMRAYGIDNVEQEEYLRSLGFKLYPHVYTVACSTLGSMASIFNVSTANLGTEDAFRTLLGGGLVHRVLKTYGYETFCVFYNTAFLPNLRPEYDQFFPPLPSNLELLTKSILMGEFRFDVSFARVVREQIREYCHNVFGYRSQRPKFVYIHNDLPKHSQNSGACLPNEIELFRHRLTQANNEMREDIQAVTAVDTDAIVIVMGDHGPFLTKNCFYTHGVYAATEISRVDVQDRFASFLAVRWPGKGLDRYDDITVLQDIFPAVLACLLQDITVLQTRVEPKTMACWSVWGTSGVSVENGVIRGGIDDGRPLFTSPHRDNWRQP